MIARRWVPPIAWAAIILTLNSVPDPDMGGLRLPGLDKLIHATLYGILGWLCARAVTRSAPAPAPPSPRTWWLAVFAGILILGALDEWHQRFVPGRSTELYDWIADGTGALVGMLAAALTRRAGAQYS
ncbi:MAG: VanZ family protein [Gemmatimonadaceae bacterium]